MKGTVKKLSLSTMVMMMGLGVGVSLVQFSEGNIPAEASVYFGKTYELKAETKIYDYEGVHRGTFPKGWAYKAKAYETIDGKTFVVITMNSGAGTFRITMDAFYRDTH